MTGNYLTKSRHGTVFYFRRRVPADLQFALGRKVLMLSLKTSERRTAIIRGRAVAVQTDILFQNIDMTKKSGKSDNLQLGFTMSIDLDELGRPSSIKFDAQPHEQDAVNSAIKTTLETAGKNQRASNSTTLSKRFADAIPEYYEKNQQKAVSKATLHARLKDASQYFGEDKNVLEIQQSDFAGYCTHVRKKIANPTTQNLYISAVAAFINWFGNHMQGHNLVTTKTLVGRKTTPDSDDRDAFTLEQLRFIFENAKQYQKRAPCKFWCSIIPVFLGCRIEEISQIHLKTDLKQSADKGIWYLTFDEHPDPDGIARKSIKKPSNWRVVPIHPVLIKHGFIDFLEAQKRAGYSRPFESQWKPHENTSEIGHVLKWSHAITKWGGRELKKLREQHSFDGNLTYFHSQRHSFKVILGNAGIPDNISEALSGRRIGSSDSERYGKIKSNYELLYEKGIKTGLNAPAEILDEVLDKST